MLASFFFALALAGTGLAQIPTGYHSVYLTSLVDKTFTIVPKTATSGAGIVVQKLTSTPAQQWYINTGNTTGKIQLANSTLCIDGGAKSNWKDLANISLTTCSDTNDGQKWVVMTDGRIALTLSSPQECLDLQYARATVNNPVGLYSCAGLGGIGAKDTGINWPPLNATV